MKAWTCTIGYAHEEVLPENADQILRQAVVAAFRELTGRAPDVASTGWGRPLSYDDMRRIEGDLPPLAYGDAVQQGVSPPFPR